VVIDVGQITHVRAEIRLPLERGSRAWCMRFHPSGALLTLGGSRSFAPALAASKLRFMDAPQFCRPRRAVYGTPPNMARVLMPFRPSALHVWGGWPARSETDGVVSSVTIPEHHMLPSVGLMPIE